MKHLILALALVSIASAKELKVLNINTAPVDSLALCLPGVGPAMAHRLDSARAVTPFASCADLDPVKGLGVKTLAKLCASVTF
jgi:DNA uptake protein ComE-like DNA-binding protein